MYFSAMYRLR